MLLDSKNNTGTIKDFVYYSVDSEKQIPDFTMMKDPKLWMYHTNGKKEWERTESSKKQNYIIPTKSRHETGSNSFNSSLVCKNNVHYAKVAGIVRKKVKNECMGKRQFINAKMLQKCLRHAEPVYLALVRPKFT